MRILLVFAGPLSISFVEAVARSLEAMLGHKVLLSLWPERLDLPAVLDLREGKYAAAKINEILRSRNKEFIDAGGRVVALIGGRSDHKVLCSREHGVISAYVLGDEEPAEVARAIANSLSAY